MKCIKYIGSVKEWKAISHTVQRLDDETANDLVNTGNWKYISKDEYKKERKG